jgi:hypothetical protein
MEEQKNIIVDLCCSCKKEIFGQEMCIGACYECLEDFYGMDI